MAVFSRITAGLVLACIATTTLLATPAEASKAIGARHLKHQQPRAHHVGAPTKGSKRSANKKRACDAKPTSLTTTSHASTSTSSPVAAKTTTSKAAAATTKASSGGSSGGAVTSGKPASGGGKAGLGWTDGSVSYMQPFLSTGKVTWCYTWSPWPCCDGSNCPEIVPMLWSGKQLGDWQTNVVGKSFKNILAFNEPDQSGQSDLSVGDAISLWWSSIEPINARHGSPAVTSSPAGLQWLDDFVAGCSGCTIDFLAFHWYGTDAQDFINTAEGIHSRHPSFPIWVTEWACEDYSGKNQQCDPGQISAFMKTTQAWLDSTSYIERYAWFGAITDWEYAGSFNQENGLIAGSKQPSSLGWQYISW